MKVGEFTLDEWHFDVFDSVQRKLGPAFETEFKGCVAFALRETLTNLITSFSAAYSGGPDDDPLEIDILLEGVDAVAIFNLRDTVETTLNDFEYETVALRKLSSGLRGLADLIDKRIDG